MTSVYRNEKRIFDRLSSLTSMVSFVLSIKGFKRPLTVCLSGAMIVLKVVFYLTSTIMLHLQYLHYKQLVLLFSEHYVTLILDRLDKR